MHKEINKSIFISLTQDDNIYKKCYYRLGLKYDLYPDLDGEEVIRHLSEFLKQMFSNTMIVGTPFRRECTYELMERVDNGIVYHLFTFRFLCCVKTCDKYGIHKCGRCLRAHYCSKECQKTDWRYHKKYCKMVIDYLGSIT